MQYITRGQGVEEGEGYWCFRDIKDGLANKWARQVSCCSQQRRVLRVVSSVAESCFVLDDHRCALERVALGKETRAADDDKGYNRASVALTSEPVQESGGVVCVGRCCSSNDRVVLMRRCKSERGRTARLVRCLDTS